MTSPSGRKAFTMFVPRAQPQRRLVTAAVGLAVLAMTACGSDTPEVTASSAPSAAPSGAPNGAAFQEIRACLEAAGLDTSGLPSGAPSGMPSGRPSGMPSGAQSDFPSGMPTGAPSGPPPAMPSGGPGGAGGMMLDAEAQAALVACGITMPSRPPAGSPTPAPSTTP
jgi:hypothetical protein